MHFFLVSATGKKFKGIREGGVMENASYYVFSKAPDGVFEAYPVDEWYNFTPIQTYKVSFFFQFKELASYVHLEAGSFFSLIFHIHN